MDLGGKHISRSITYLIPELLSSVDTLGDIVLSFWLADLKEADVTVSESS